jgi:hypothetical protein
MSEDPVCKQHYNNTMKHNSPAFKKNIVPNSLEPKDIPDALYMNFDGSAA